MATDQQTNERLRVVILNQYYAPDVASTGQLLHELAHELARQNLDVKVITCRPSYGPPETWKPCPRHEISGGVEVRRMLSTRFSKDNLIGRLTNIATFLGNLSVRMLFSRGRRNVFLYTSNPPFLAIIGALVSLVRHHKYVVLLHDAYPDVAVWVGKIKSGSLIERMWHRVNRFFYRRAEQTIVLCEAAKKLVCDHYGVDPARVHVVHNWANADLLKPKPKHESAFAQEHGLVEPFTVLYSGNIGLYYDFETALGAAEILKNENFRLVIIGGGGRKQWVADEIKRRNLTNTLLLPYQPYEKLPESLTACDASLVTIAKGIEGISFPSKLYSTLSVGRAVLALAEPDSEMRRMIEDNDAGRFSAVGDPEALAKVIREMMADPARCERQGRNARAFFEREFTIAAAGAKYARVLRDAYPGERGSTESPAQKPATQADAA